jgi:hypothetical protein
MRTLYPHRAETRTRVARLPRMQPEGGQSGLRRPAVTVLAVLALMAVIVALAAVFGLGPFDDDGGSTTTLDKAQFTAKGDQVCKAAHQKFVELQKTPPKSAEGAATLTQNLIEISENELSQIRALDVPPQVQPALDRYLQAREQGIAELKKGLQAAQDKNARAYADAQAKIAAGQVQRLKLAREVGFSDCSRVPVQGGTGP